MDQERFDEITRALANNTDRRAVFKRLAGGALGGLLGLAGVGAAGATHKKGHHCTPSDKHSCPTGYECVKQGKKWTCVKPPTDCRKTGCPDGHECKYYDGKHVCKPTDCRKTGCPKDHECKPDDKGKYYCKPVPPPVCGQKCDPYDNKQSCPHGCYCDRHKYVCKPARG